MNYDEFFAQFEKDMNGTCIHCQKDCPCTALATYFRKVGLEEFKREYNNFNLPEEIEIAFKHYIDLVSDKIDD